MITPDQMVAHVLEIRDRHDIELHWVDGWKAYTVGECLQVYTPKVRGQVTYATALHEIGHCLGRYQPELRRVGSTRRPAVAPGEP
jgi:hypothetical protein